MVPSNPATRNALETRTSSLKAAYRYLYCPVIRCQLFHARNSLRPSLAVFYNGWDVVRYNSINAVGLSDEKKWGVVPYNAPYRSCHPLQLTSQKFCQELFQLPCPLLRQCAAFETHHATVSFDTNHGKRSAIYSDHTLNKFGLRRSN